MIKIIINKQNNDNNNEKINNFSLLTSFSLNWLKCNYLER